MKETTFGFYETTRAKTKIEEYGNLDLALIGDSQLHTAVFGTGLPGIVQSELNGQFRWGSKSWSGFSPPDIFLEVIPTDVPQPRVVAMWFLPSKFWAKAKGKYKAKPMPAVSGGKQVESSSEVPNEVFTATVEIPSVVQRAAIPLSLSTPKP